MGFRPSTEELAELIEEIDEDGSGAIEFAEFAQERINRSNPKYILCQPINVIKRNLRNINVIITLFIYGITTNYNSVFFISNCC